MGLPLHAVNFAKSAALVAAGLHERAARYPIAVCFFLTYRCELHCRYCLENVRHRCPDGVPRELDTAGVRATLAALRSVCDSVDFSGGEPTLRPDLPEILEECTRLGYAEVMLNTNALHLDGPLDWLRHVGFVVVGIDSLREEGFLRITGGTHDQYRAQREGLERLCRLRDHHRFDLAICAVLLDGFLDELQPLADWCFARGVMLSVSPHLDGLEVHAGLRRNPRYRELAATLVDWRRRGLPLLGSRGYYEALRDLSPHRCVPMANLTLAPTGEIFWPCGEIQHRGPRFLDGLSFPEMLAAARAEHGPLPRCRDRCHFSCRLAFSDLIVNPWQLPEELRHQRRWRRWWGRK